MMDQYLQEQHTYQMQRAQGQKRPSHSSLNSDQGSSWVMMRENGDIVRLQGESIRYRANKISLDLTVPRSLQQSHTSFSRKSDNGSVYITTSRIIYIPAKPTDDFKSFQAWILDCQDSCVGSPLFGAWYWSTTVKPTSGGGIPPDLPRLELKLSFREGGHSDFGQKFELQKERLEHIRQVRQETGQTINIPDEPLPAYEANARGANDSSNLAAQAAQPSFPRSTSATSQNPTPSEPPPGYDEAQAQNLSMRLETHVRDEAQRGQDD